MATTDVRSSPAQRLLHRSLNLLDHIHSQINEWKSCHTNSEFFTLPSSYTPSAQPYPCEVVTHFSNLNVANVVTFYNAVLILINRFVISTCELLPFTGTNKLINESASDEIYVAVMEILKNIDYHIQFTQKTVTSPRNLYLLLPIRIAHRALSESQSAQNITRKLWLEDVLNYITIRAGPWTTNRSIFGLEKS